MSTTPLSHAMVRGTLYALLIFAPLARGSVQGWAVCAIHMTTLIALTVFLLEKAYSGNWQWIRTPLDRPIFILLVLAALSCVFSLHLRSSLWAMVLMTNYVVIFYTIIHTVRTRSDLKRLLYVVIGVATFLSIFGFMKRFGVNPFPWWKYGDLNYSHELLASTYGNHNHLAGYLEMALPLALGLLLTGIKGGRLILMVYQILIILTALVLTLSRGGWLAAAFGLSFMAYARLTNRRSNRSAMVLSLLIGVTCLVLFVLANTAVVERFLTVWETEGDASFRSRLLAWQGALAMIMDYPLLGTGPGTFALVFTQYQPPGLTCQFTKAHNDYLHFTAEVGLLLLPILIYMGFTVFREGLKKLKSPSRLVRGTTLGVLSSITALSCHSIVDFNLHIPANALLFTVLAAIAVAPLPKT